MAKKAAAKKIQVKMLKDVPGTGQRGDVVQVTPAFFNNKLLPSRSAEVISDEEVAAQESEKAAALAQEKIEATALKEALELKTLELKRKAGPDGHLFGGVNAKNVMEEIVSQFPGHNSFWNKKSVKITGLTNGDGKKMRGDIKVLGEFGAEISLTKDIQSSVKLVVVPEE
jgi:ribosomal protein L9